MFLIILVLLNSNLKLTSFFTAGAGYQDFYISSVHPNRNDNNPGTDPNYPWATFGHMTEVWNQQNSQISAGDIIHLDKGSTFYITAQWKITKGGSSGHPITIRGDDYDSQSKSNLAILKASGTFNGAVFWINSGSYITLRDFWINGNAQNISSGVTIGGYQQPSDITNIEVLNLKIYNLASNATNYTSGIWLAADSTHSVSNCLIQGNDISGYNAWGINSYPKKTTGGFQGFHYNNIFRNNYVHDFHEPRYGSLGGGIHIALGGSGNIYEYNIVEGGTFIGSMVVVNNSATETGLIIRYNVLKNNNGLNDVEGSNKTGILFTVDYGGYPNGTIEADVYGNIISGNDHPAIVFDGSNVFSEGTVNIYNNTIYNNNKNLNGYANWGGAREGAEIVIHTTDDIDIMLKNNIIVPTKANTASLKITDKYTATLTTSNNLYWNTNGANEILVNKKGTTYTSSNITSFEPTAKSANPLFTNATLVPTSLSNTNGANPDGLKPQNTSIAMDNATNLGTLYNYDIDLKQRNGTWDIGAYEISEGTTDPPIVTPNRNFYVSSNSGNNNNNGLSESSPWKTLDKVKSVWNAGGIVAGDTIHLKRGEIFDFGGMTINSGGTLENPITINGEDWGDTSKPKALIKHITGATDIFWIRGSYLNFIGLTIDGNGIWTHSGFMVENNGSNIYGINIINNTIKNLWPAGGAYNSPIYLAAHTGYTINNCLIQGNDVSGFSGNGLNHYPNDGGILNNIIWKGNYIHDFQKPHYGDVGNAIHIRLTGGSNNVFENNVVEGDFHLGSVHIQYKGSDNKDEQIIFRNNIIKNNRWYLPEDRGAGTGVIIDRSNQVTSKMTIDFYGNIIYGNSRTGIAVAGALGTFNFYNNILYGNLLDCPSEITFCQAEIVDEGNNGQINFKNNIIEKTTNVGTGLRITTNGWTVFNNLFWGTNGSSSQAIYNQGTTYTIANINNFGTNNIGANPLLETTSEFVLKPKNESPTIDNGTILNIDNKDIIGILRPQGNAWDIGAYEIISTPSILPTCVESDWVNSDGVCQSNNMLTRTWTKIGTCEGGVTHSSPENVSCIYNAPTCTSFTYTQWTPTICPQSATQTRTILTQTPTICQGGNPILTQPCNYIPTCKTEDWVYYDEACQVNNTLIRNWFKANNCINGVTQPEVESIACSYNSPTCETFSYSEWTPIICSQTGTQVRTITSSTPTPCQGGNFESLFRSCTYTPICTDNYWDYTLEPTICPQEEVQTKKYFKIINCEGGISKIDENVPCVFNSPVCEYDYSEYGECVNGLQTRTASATNEPCQKGITNLTQKCTTNYVCTEAHWSFTIENCINGIQLKDWRKIGDCNNGIQHFDENISCSIQENPIQYCGSEDWNFRIEPTICPSTKIQTKYWTRTNSNCQAGLTHLEQEKINCTPINNNQINSPSDGTIDLYKYTTKEIIEEIEESNDQEAIRMLTKALVSLQENNNQKATAQINTALLKTRTNTEPELQTKYEEVLTALNNEDYITANELALNALKEKNNLLELFTLHNIIIALAILVILVLIINKTMKIRTQPPEQFY